MRPVICCEFVSIQILCKISRWRCIFNPRAHSMKMRCANIDWLATHIFNQNYVFVSWFFYEHCLTEIDDLTIPQYIHVCICIFTIFVLSLLGNPHDFARRLAGSPVAPVCPNPYALTSPTTRHASGPECCSIPKNKKPSRQHSSDPDFFCYFWDWLSTSSSKGSLVKAMPN